MIANVRKFFIVIGKITGYDAPGRIKRHNIASFAFPIINPPSKPKSGKFSLTWFPNKLTSSQKGEQDLVDYFEPAKIIKLTFIKIVWYKSAYNSLFQKL